MNLNWFEGAQTKDEMNILTISEIEIIMGDLSTSAEQKVISTNMALWRLRVAWNVKKALLQAEPEEKIILNNCITKNLTVKEKRVRVIKLTQGQVALVDEEDYEELIKYKWHATRSNPSKPFYATRTIYTPDKKYKTERMHRDIMSPPKGMQVDHISGDTLDNTRSNLRIVTPRENNQNYHRRKSSIFPGVCLHSPRGKWQAKIEVNGKNHHIGLYESEVEAFKAYLEACVMNGFSIEFLINKFNISLQEHREEVSQPLRGIDVAKVESLLDFPLIERGPACKECDCFKCNKSPNCHIEFPTTLHYCEKICNGKIGIVFCEHSQKGIERRAKRILRNGA